MAVAENSLYTYFIGTAGVGVTSLDGTSGSATWWVSAATIAVPGGPFGGVRAANGGAGGTAVLTSAAGFVGTFTVKTAGGNGGNGVNSNDGGGGGGGGSGGDTASGSNGAAGTASTGGAGGVAGTTNGGIGGVGGSLTANGIAPVSGNGGGGGGSGEGVVKGGDGAVGKIILVHFLSDKGRGKQPQQPPLDITRQPQQNAVAAPQAAGIESLSMPPYRPS